MIAFLRLVRRNLTRHWLRNSLTTISIAIALFLMTAVASLLMMIDIGLEEAKSFHRLFVMGEQGITSPVPLKVVDELTQDPEIAGTLYRSGETLGITPFAFFGGTYPANEREQFAQFAINPASWPAIFTERQLDAGQLREWIADRTTCVIGIELSRRLDKKVGDRIALKGNIYPISLDLRIVGTYDGRRADDLQTVFFHMEYVQEQLRANKDPRAGFAGIILLKVADRGDDATTQDHMNRVSRAVDLKYMSAERPTKTQTEEQFVDMFMEMQGNVMGFLRNTAIAVVFALVLVAANSVTQSLRERTVELSVMRALGFRAPFLMSLILFEGIVIGLAGSGAAVGLVSGLLTAMGNSIPGVVPYMYVPTTVAVGTLAVGLGIGLASTAVPAWLALRPPILDGLRRVG